MHFELRTTSCSFFLSWGHGGKPRAFSPARYSGGLWSGMSAEKEHGTNGPRPCPTRPVVQHLLLLLIPHLRLYLCYSASPPVALSFFLGAWGRRPGHPCPPLFSGWLLLVPGALVHCRFSGSAPWPPTWRETRGGQDLSSQPRPVALSLSLFSFFLGGMGASPRAFSPAPVFGGPLVGSFGGERARDKLSLFLFRISCEDEGEREGGCGGRGSEDFQSRCHAVPAHYSIEPCTSWPRVYFCGILSFHPLAVYYPSQLGSHRTEEGAAGSVRSREKQGPAMDNHENFKSCSNQPDPAAASLNRAAKRARTPRKFTCCIESGYHRHAACFECS